MNHEFLQAFAKPDRKYSANAFWFWNGTLDPDRMVWQMEQMEAQGVYNAFMHARGYLVTPYMEEEWFAVVDACVRRAKEIGFFPWLYDEYAWPSGTAGSTFDFGFQKPSRVLAKGERNMAKGLDVWRRQVQGPQEVALPEDRGAPLAAYVTSGETVRRVDGGKTSVAVPAGEHTVMAFYRRVYPKAVDYLNKETIAEFIQVTHEVYKEHYGDDFGTVIPGVFFDEIYLIAHPLPWTDGLDGEFLKRRGYDLMDVLPLLMQGEDERAQGVRRDYYRLLGELYEEAFFKQVADWCADNRLELTGHTEEFVGGHPRRQGDFFRTVRHLQIPGADCHDYRYRLPRKISFHEPKYAVSVARAYDKPRAMSEAFGGAGWGCSLQEIKRGVNTLGAMGIGMLTLHGFYYEVEHMGSQGDWPTSFFYQNPYWKYFHQLAAYMQRVSYVNCVGRAVVDVGLYYPIDEVCAHTVGGDADEYAWRISVGFNEALAALVSRQMDTDMIDAESLARAEVREGRLCVGAQAFAALVLPAGAMLSAGLREKLDEFVAQGGQLAFYPGRDGEPPPQGWEGFPVCAPEAIPEAIAARLPLDVRLVDGGGRELYVNHRRIDGLDVYMVANSLDEKRDVTLWMRCEGPTRLLDPETGAARGIAGMAEDGGTRVRLALEPDQAVYVMFGGEPVENEEPPRLADWEYVLGRWEFLPLEREKAQEWAIDATETEIEIPLALFAAEGGVGTDRIRVKNTPWEDGACGRHLSQWQGKWLGRRIGWVDDSEAGDLYFRGMVRLAQTPQSARVCLAAVNRYTLYVNGQEVQSGDSYAKGVTVDLAGRLRAGDNLIAVRVHCENPLSQRSVNEAEELPPDRIASLVLQGEAVTAEGTVTFASGEDWLVTLEPPEDWMSAGCDAERHAIRVDAATGTGFTLRYLKDTDWLNAWERGRPPMLPWGEVALFGETPAYPQRVYYTIEIPAGTARILPPRAQGEALWRLDGRPVSFEQGGLEVAQDGLVHQLQLECAARGPKDGLLEGVRVVLRPWWTELGDWARKGLSWFSGQAMYRNVYRARLRAGRRYWLELCDVRYQAEVWVNGTLCGTRVWAPYRVEVTDALRDGENEIVIVASNSAACERRHMLVDEGMALGWNRYWNGDNMDREPQHYVSGLLGPVRVWHD